MRIERYLVHLPEVLMRTTNVPPHFNVAREFMRNRYYHARTIISRSSLLYVAHDQVRKSEDIVSQHQPMLELCSQIACDAVDTIALYWTPNRIHVWNSAWCLFQACTIPLL